MTLFRRLLGKKDVVQQSARVDQAVIVHLDGIGLPPEIYEKCDVSTLEDQLIEIIDAGRLGEFDGNEFGPEEVTLFMYGPDAERLYAAIAETLLAYPLCRGAKVEIRYGAPGARTRVVTL